MLVHKALFSSEPTREAREGVKSEKECGLQRMVMSTMILWAQQPIHSPELIQQIFSLLYRQCDEINEVVMLSLAPNAIYVAANRRSSVKTSTAHLHKHMFYSVNTRLVVYSLKRPPFLSHSCVQCAPHRTHAHVI